MTRSILLAAIVLIGSALGFADESCAKLTGAQDSRNYDHFGAECRCRELRGTAGAR